MNNTNFNWTEFYKEFADVLRTYSKNRDVLLEKLQTVYESIGMKFPTLEKNGAIIDVDPFTVFGFFNKGLTDKNRIKIMKGIANEFGIESNIPDKFEGIPVLNAVSANFFWYEDLRGKHDIDNLWEMFEAALQYVDNKNEATKSYFMNCYDSVMQQSGVKWNLTMGFYWIRPYDYLNLDGRNRWFINNENNMPSDFVEQLDDFKYVPTGEEYLEIVDACKAVLDSGAYEYSSFPELSYRAWITATEDDEREAQEEESGIEQEGTDVADGYWPSLEEYDPCVSSEEWVEFLTEDQKKYPATLEMLYAMQELGGEATCKKLSQELGGHPSTYVSRGNTLGRRIKNKYGLPSCMDGDVERFYPISFFGRSVVEDGKQLYAWKIRPELDEALQTMLVESTDANIETQIEKENKEAFKRWFKGQVIAEPDTNAGKAYSEITINTYVNKLSSMRVTVNGVEMSAYKTNDVTDIENMISAVQQMDGNNVHKAAALKKYKQFLEEIDSIDRIVYKTDIKTGFELNRIIFGAPGTGKSFTINAEKEILLGEKSRNYERVTFHPDYSYANFVGTYKPVPCIDSDGNDAITYEYVPGPFMRTLVKALKSAKSENAEPFLLIIEEINRANVASVFGDVFQLLDRDDDGISEYPIQASEDIKKYLAKELGGNASDYDEIRIPNNMFIWASMNSADQGVFPMDTAFKRRWDFTYIGINASEEGIIGKTVVLGKDEYEREVEWNQLRSAINKELLSYKVNEDKLMGPYFISKKVLGSDNIIDSERFIQVFKNKVIMYLFDDAAKQKRPSLFAGCEEKNLYSAICEEFDKKGVDIFCDNISNAFGANEDE